MRRILISTLGLLATLAIVLVSAGSAAARATPSGTFTVKSGQTISFTNTNIYSDSGDWAVYTIYDSNGAQYGSSYLLGQNGGHEGTNYSFSGEYSSWFNDSGGTVTVVLGLWDYSNYGVSGYPEYWSNGTSEYTGTSVNHAKLGYVKGKVVVSINDTNGGTETTSDSIPTLGAGDFNATVKIGKH
jgi:hypothetical protein